MLASEYSKDKIEAGCDEVGRGCLAGPVVAAAVILPKNYKHKILTDSKQLSAKKRELVQKDIVRDAISYAIAELSNEEVDQHNVLKASFLAMHKALDNLSIPPELILVDGNRFIPYKQIQYECIVKGDSKYLSIAAASVLAKTYRDSLMSEYSVQYPEYHWSKNVGYPTREHREAIRAYGITPLHRRSFKLLPDQLELF